jgi:arginine repressor
MTVLLLVWTSQVPWSAELATRVRAAGARAYNSSYALASASADSVEARTELANATPRIERVPALIVIETGPNGQKRIEAAYDRTDIEAVVGALIGS